MLRICPVGLLLSVTAVAATPLELEDCRISAGPGFTSVSARCGVLERPLNPAAPDAGTIDISVAVVPALDLNPEPDPFVPIAGGPGQASVAFYAAYRLAFEEVRLSRDILLVDQRGTGDSSPMDCPVEDAVVEGEFTTEETIEAMRECLEALPHDPRYFTTSVAVTDLEAVRRALGYDKLNIYGISYGSRVAQHFARRYPDSTRTVILDGVVPPQLALGPEIAIEAQRALDRIFARCREDVACNVRFPDLASRFALLKQSLDDVPADLELPNPVTGRRETIEFGRAEMAIALRLLAYQPSTIALVPMLVHKAASGRVEPLAAQYLIAASQVINALAIGMHNAVMCTEDVPFIDSNSVDQEALRKTFIGEHQLEALEAICSVWPAGPLDPDLHEPLETNLPVLLLSGDADPITPPRYAELAAVDLGNARHIIGREQGHGLASVGCAPVIIADFIATADVNGLDTECLERSFVMPFFLDYAGPEP